MSLQQGHTSDTAAGRRHGLLPPRPALFGDFVAWHAANPHQPWTALADGHPPTTGPATTDRTHADPAAVMGRR